MRMCLSYCKFLFLCLIFGQHVLAQDAMTVGNPFAKYIGVWGLQDGEFQIIEDDKVINTLIFQSHVTDCNQVNTELTVLCEITAEGLAGHVLWSYDKTAARMHHLSHFGPVGEGANAVGVGEIDEHGNIRSKVTFEDLPIGAFRIYEYRWVSINSYEMSANEFDAEGEETGRGYRATYSRQ